MRDLSLHLMDILENSISARADNISIMINTDKEKDILTVMVVDDGQGMDEKYKKLVTNPFVTSRTMRCVGLGIPLFKASSERAKGRFSIDSENGEGTSLIATFKISHIDRLPLGDIASSIISILLGKTDINIELLLNNVGEEEFKFDLGYIRERLGDVPINHLTVIEWIKNYINNGITNIFGGVLDEIVS